MNSSQYWKNQLPMILIQLLGSTALVLFLLASGTPLSSVLFISGIWLAVATLSMAIRFFIRKRRLNLLLCMAEQLEERYLIPEIMDIPELAEEQVYYQILKLAEKSMLEQIGEIQRERKEYKEYIEQWIHEVKTPITAMQLICENNRAPFTRECLAELEQVSRFTEQALYYARSEHAEKDYSIREIPLGPVIHGAIADQKYLLRQNQVAVTVEEMEHYVYADDKWVRFILNQLISNAVKYRSAQPALHIFAEKKDGQILLSVEDNGMGIPAGDLPRIFEKGFTGQNGRRISTSTGIGLYLCKRLCDKLGIGLSAYSQGKGTTMVLAFPVNDFVLGVQG